jgi:hypothetical protein
MILSKPESTPAIIIQNLGHSGCLRWQLALGN